MSNDESRRFGAQGGRKRAANMTRAERKEQAQRAALARWGSDVPVAIYNGDLQIGDLKIPCAVLEDGTRVLSEGGITRALLGSRSGASKRIKYASIKDGGPPTPIFLAPGVLKSFISNDLSEGALTPVPYRVGERLISGFRADILPLVCDVWLRAREAGALSRQQLDKAKQAEILMRGLAHVGIIALVDEATGYQADRARDALAKVLEAFVQKELRKWVRTFPAQFYEELYRLRGLSYPPRAGAPMPSYFGHLTNNIVYDRLAPGVKDALKRVTPRNAKGRHKQRLFQRLTEDVGHPKLLEHLASVVALMKISPDYSTFEGFLDRALPKWTDQLRLPQIT